MGDSWKFRYDGAMEVNRRLAADILRLIEERDAHRTRVARLEHALHLIATGHISPAIRFAEQVLAGVDPSEALKEGRG